jgi:hypothetical protein
VPQHGPAAVQPDLGSRLVAPLNVDPVRHPLVAVGVTQLELAAVFPHKLETPLLLAAPTIDPGMHLKVTVASRRG